MGLQAVVVVHLKSPEGAVAQTKAGLLSGRWECPCGYSRVLQGLRTPRAMAKPPIHRASQPVTETGLLSRHTPPYCHSE